MNNFDQELIKKHLPKEQWEDAFLQLEKGYPVQYIIGNVDFCSCLIKVNEKVLIPRFETEYLVASLIKLIKKYNFDNPDILDIGTGSGCISIAIKNMISASITAIDISNDAIKVAKENAETNKVNIDFKMVSIEEYKDNKKFDIIVSNPPYVTKNSPIDEKIKYEPQDAIYAKDNGLYFYKVILEKAKDLLKEKFIIAFEIGYNQGEDILKIAKKQFTDANIYYEKDLQGYDRYFYIVKA